MFSLYNPLIDIKEGVYSITFARSRRSLAEFKQELFKDEDGSGGAEDDEGLPAEEAEDGPGQSRTQEALHHTLSEEETQKQAEDEDERLSERRWWETKVQKTSKNIKLQTRREEERDEDV